MLGIPEHEKVNHGILRKYGVSESEIRRLTGKGKFYYFSIKNRGPRSITDSLNLVSPSSLMNMLILSLKEKTDGSL